MLPHELFLHHGLVNFDNLHLVKAWWLGVAGPCGHSGSQLDSPSDTADEGGPGLVLHCVRHDDQGALPLGWSLTLGVEDVDICVLRGVLRHGCLLELVHSLTSLVSLTTAYSLHLFLRVSITKYEGKLKILILGFFDLFKGFVVTAPNKMT